MDVESGWKVDVESGKWLVARFRISHKYLIVIVIVIVSYFYFHFVKTDVRHTGIALPLSICDYSSSWA